RVFFFSSRRRHTSFSRDWSSDVCSSDLGWVFRPFNRFFGASSEKYQATVSRTLGRRGMVFAVYALLLLGTGLMFQGVPAGFIPRSEERRVGKVWVRCQGP